MPTDELHPRIRSTTILAVRRGEKAALGGDGQVTLNETVLKQGARKVRRLYGDRVVAGFAGGTADALTLFEKFEEKLESHGGNLPRAAVELAKLWRTDRTLRRLEALLIVADAERSLLISGSGDVIEADDGVLSIGSGSSYAIAAARALVQHTDMPPAEITQKALEIAADICLYTNRHIIVEEV